MNQMSLDQVIDGALQDFSIELAKTEIEIFKSRSAWRSCCRLTAYFQSTPEKAAFSRLMYLAACVKQPYTITEICNELSISRQTICTFRDDCLAEGWILCTEPAVKNYKYMASQELCAKIVAYADYSSDMFLKGSMHDSENFLSNLKRRKAALRCQD